MPYARFKELKVKPLPFFAELFLQAIKALLHYFVISDQTILLEVRECAISESDAFSLTIVEGVKVFQRGFLAESSKALSI